MTEPDNGMWTGLQRLIWVLLLMLALFTWLALVLLVLQVHAPDYRPNTALILNIAIRISLSLFAGLTAGSLIISRPGSCFMSNPPSWPAAGRLQRAAMLSTTALALLLWLLIQGVLSPL